LLALIDLGKIMTTGKTINGDHVYQIV